MNKPVSGVRSTDYTCLSVSCELISQVTIENVARDRIETGGTVNSTLSVAVSFVRVNYFRHLNVTVSNHL